MNTRNWLSAGIVIVCLIVAGLWYFDSPSGEVSSSIPPTDQTEEAALDAIEQNRMEENLALVREAYLDLLHTALKAQQKLDAFRTAYEHWHKVIAPLLTNDDGRYIAASASDVDSFRGWYDVDSIPTLADADALEKSIDTLVAPLQAALDQKSVKGMPQQRVSTRLEELATESEQLLMSLTTAIESIEAILARARRNNTPAELTLGACIEELEASASAKEGAEISRIREEADAEVAAMRANDEEQRLERLRREEAARLEAEREKQALIDLANSERVQGLLAPFIQLNNNRPRTSRAGRYGKPLLRWERASSPEPMSIDALRVFGVLDGERDPQKARERLQLLANHEQNERDSWPVVQDDWAAIEEVRQLLIQLGPTLVELGHLRTN